ncbi:peroxide stress protein YaaA [Desulfopila sp. IMCC35008]|uniref:peroxide stress protein YaaA n=1 Tax=Desulfopila sp. IMCC35008 TaxID=2653858 RepID=UPI0013D4079C|nr:peroxide stress protein YaaA [Desulfopila sp. IMCC35008]
MLLIVAPSKTQKPIQNDAPFTEPLFSRECAHLNRYLGKLSLEDLCRLMKMSEKLGQLTAGRIKSFQFPFTRENSTQALFTFQGDSYDALRPAEYSTEQLQHGQDHLCILSGLYGILRPLDLMQPYRLEMATKLETDSGKNLYDFWGNSLTNAINDICGKKGYDTLINLASAEYSKSIRPKELHPAFLTITFKEKKGDGYKTIPIHSKRARGMIIDYMITECFSEASQLKTFTGAGYRFNEELTTDTEWIFTRES